MMAEIVTFQDVDGKPSVNVRLDGNTVWLTQKQMAELFDTSRVNITQHLTNIFSDGELEEKATCKDFLQVQSEGSRSVSRDVAHYNLDAIISVGYRINSKQGVKFRQWATQTLNDHLVKGFTLNQHRIAERGMDDVLQAMDLVSRTLLQQDDLSNESREVMAIVSNYAKTWKTLLQYDEQSLPMPVGSPSICSLEYEPAISEINRLKQVLISQGEATPLFGQERGEALQGILGSIEQTMFGEPLYKSREEKAANLLYFIIKDHPFSDGNKRIGAFMFLRYMDQQKMDVHVSPDAMSALALLVAESNPTNKDLMIRLTMNSIVEQRNLVVGQDTVISSAQDDLERVASWDAAITLANEKDDVIVAGNSERMEFDGTAISSDRHHVVQSLGRNAAIHKSPSLSRIPVIGESFSVKYDEHGHGEVAPRERVGHANGHGQ